MPGVTATEDFILNLKDESRLSAIKNLSLRNMGIDTLDAGVFTKMPQLEVLDLSNNHIRQIPGDLRLRKLRKLDCSQNSLTSVEFVVQFPALEELYMEGNELQPSDRYIAAALLPNIKTIERTSRDSLQRTVDSYREKLEPQIEEVWADSFAAKMLSSPGMLSSDARRESTSRAVLKAVQSKHPYGQSSQMLKFRDFMLQLLVDEVMSQVASGTYQPTPRAKKPRMGSPQMSTKLGSPLNSTRSGSPSTSAWPSLSVKPKKPSHTPNRFTGVKAREPLCESGAAQDYEPRHFIRCHFGDREAVRQKRRDNDPTDEYTKVWQCAFEPHPYDEDKTTGLVATVGGNIVCLIDCGTGKVLKRFKEQRQQFSVLAWTTLSIQSGGKTWPTNILAVGGYNGYLRLLHPDQLVCYKELGDGRPNKATAQGGYFINTMIFHPKNATWLFTGSSDTTVTLWDIGIPKGPSYQTDCSQLAVLTSPAGEVMSLGFHLSTHHLVAGCVGGCYVWKVQPDSSKTNKRRSADCKIVLPSFNKSPKIDSIAIVGEDYIACKCYEDHVIYVWKATSTLKAATRGRSVCAKMAATLEWKVCQEEYISIGVRNGVLACGDEEGNIRLYDLNKLMSNKMADASTTLKPSRMLPWPECVIDKKREPEQQMKDVLDKPTPLIVNCVAFSGDLQYLVGGTDNNLVCIWKADKSS